MTVEELSEILKIDFFRTYKKFNTATLGKIKRNEYKEEVLTSLQHHTSFLPKEQSIQERVYCIINNIKSDKNLEGLHYVGFKKGYVKRGKSRKNSIKRPKITSDIFLALKTKEEVKEFFLDNFLKDGTAINRFRLNTYPVFITIIEDYTKNIITENIVEKAYCLLHEIEEQPKCLMCDKKARFNSWKDGYRLYCDQSCQIEHLKIDNAVAEYSKTNKGKTYEEIHGEEKAKEIKKIQSEKGRLRYTTDTLFRCNYNRSSIKWLDYINNELGFKGIHAGNKESEHGVLGYYVDFYDEKNNLIIEWNERSHYVLDENKLHLILREKDVVRKNNILNHFDNKINYLDINETEFLKLESDELKKEYLKNLLKDYKRR